MNILYTAQNSHPVVGLPVVSRQPLNSRKKEKNFEEKEQIRDLSPFFFIKEKLKKYNRLQVVPPKLKTSMKIFCNGNFEKHELPETLKNSGIDIVYELSDEVPLSCNYQ